MPRDPGEHIQEEDGILGLPRVAGSDTKMDDILLQVRKPARYIGREWNLPEKDFAKASVRFALCFPDMYEIGMSNLGVRIMYDVLNSIPGVGCERFFSPADDYAALVRSGDISFGSLETASPPGAFDMLGFSLGSELAYTNVLHVLSLGNIPLLSAERTPEHPFVFAG
ncbi:MAG: hypothetical protein MJA29_09560, partial [Candidatus Omnitrophica bacterium]|nr:hypothetical protein [Candidatus Omnitrophota bacterium]